MTPEQLQQMSNQAVLQWFSQVPFWIKALMALQVLSMLVTVICLPLITWKLYFGNKPGNATSLSPAEQIRLQQTRDRREALQKVSAPISPISGGDTQKSVDADSRYMPKQ